MGAAASLALKLEVSEIVMSSIGIFPVDLPVSFNFSYMNVFREKPFDYQIALQPATPTLNRCEYL